ncbi:MAG: 50S ribosomal protein L11 methyltransferase [Burkholderiaceae bacterium]
MPWQISFVCRPEPAANQTADQWLEDLSDRFIAEGALSVSIEDADADQSDKEQPLFGEPGSDQALRAWPASRLQLLLADDQDPHQWWQNSGMPIGASPPDVARLQEEDWVTKTQAQFTPLAVGDRLWVGPSWQAVPAQYRQAPRIALTIDPGMAFGTGGHATTQLCLEAILQASDQGLLIPASRVIDYGCGSGILGLAAAACGVEQVVAIDIDPVAVTVARSNARLNGLGHRVRCIAAQEDIFAQADLASPGFDLVVANILAQPLKLLAPLLWRLTALRGGLILSGLLSRQAESLIAWYADADPARPSLQVLGQRDGWACIGIMPR